ncbi:hypothetical protein B7494_g3720 [Chlorociboria aeruginascens]|nr:hypothetical protein B7494_g3720 [Chlorociboria aeruginascens]
MSVSRPARCLFAVPSIPKVRSRSRYQNFHTSPNLPLPRKPRFASLKASEMGLISNRIPAKEHFRPYTEEERKQLENIYTPEQIEAIEAGEAAIDPEDLKSHGIIRTDLGRLPYLDDLSVIQPTIDKKLPRPEEPLDPNLRLMDEDELGESLGHEIIRYLDQNPKGLDRQDPDYLNKIRPNSVDLLRAQDDAAMFMGTDGPIRGPHYSELAPGLPTRFLDPSESEDGKKEKQNAQAEKDQRRDPEGIYKKLQKETGYTLEYIMDLKVKILVRHSVTNVTRLGKVMSQYCLAIAGNGNGRLGLGESKGQETEDTSNNARIAAIRNMRPVPRYEQRTIYGDVDGKVSGVEVKLMSRPPGNSFLPSLCYDLMLEKDLVFVVNITSSKWLEQLESMILQPEFHTRAIQ